MHGESGVCRYGNEPRAYSYVSGELRNLPVGLVGAMFVFFDRYVTTVLGETANAKRAYVRTAPGRYTRS